MYCIKFIKNPCSYVEGQYCAADLTSSIEPFNLGGINAAYSKLEELWTFHRRHSKKCDCVFEVVEV